MIIYGWNHKTRSVKGGVAEKQCGYCNTRSEWQLCVKRTWFTLFFIPIIPYHTEYCIDCPNCGSYIALDKVKYKEILEELKKRENVSR